MFPAEFMVQIPDKPGVCPDHAVGYIVVITILLIFIRDVEYIAPFVSGVLHLVPAFPGKGEERLPVCTDPDVLCLLFHFFHLFRHAAIQLFPNPAQDAVP